MDRDGLGCSGSRVVADVLVRELINLDSGHKREYYTDALYKVLFNPRTVTSMTKAHILQEIKRTAEANRGVPLGMGRFRSETGIKQSDWFGVYWARWSEAIVEAGLTPNQLQGAYDKTELLDKYVALVRELGRLPAKGDLRLKARVDADFPSDGTFGTKPELIKQLVEYCQDRPGHEDVIRLCEAYSSRKQELPDETSPQAVAVGFVYLTKSGRFYKIGKTNAVGRRERELALQLPEKSTTVHVIRTDDPTGIEAYWHKRFEVKWKNGEWFDLSAADVSAFKRRKFM
jgi:Meiotically Up-regulated Gene 113 (MUG113) protein